MKKRYVQKMLTMALTAAVICSSDTGICGDRFGE